MARRRNSDSGDDRLIDERALLIKISGRQKKLDENFAHLNGMLGATIPTLATKNEVKLWIKNQKEECRKSRDSLFYDRGKDDNKTAQMFKVIGKLAGALTVMATMGYLLIQFAFKVFQ